MLIELCPQGHATEIDWSRLEIRQTSKLSWLEGFTCPTCGKWKTLWLSSPRMQENLKRLFEMKPTHPSFWYYFVKARKRAEEIQKRGRNEYG